MTPEREAAIEEYRQACEAGMSPNEVAEYVFRAIRDEKFYILSDTKFGPYVKARAEALLQGRDPLSLAELAALSEAQQNAFTYHCLHNEIGCTRLSSTLFKVRLAI